VSADLSTFGIRGVLFDVDGTLYHARPMRMRVVLALLMLPLSGWRRARRIWRQIRCYRRALEEVRHAQGDNQDVTMTHLRHAAELSGHDVEEIRSTVQEWLMERPVPYLRRCRRRGLVELLEDLQGRGIKLGFFSDYPVLSKLQALGVDSYGSVYLSAGDPAINAYKPRPDGFLRAAELLGLPPAEVLYVGDRPEVDAVGAANAGMPCVILGGKGNVEGSGFLAVSGFAELRVMMQNPT
jgi:HAD superfamily hydrolase (TIGR01549 family)